MRLYANHELCSPFGQGKKLIEQYQRRAMEAGPSALAQAEAEQPHTGTESPPQQRARQHEEAKEKEQAESKQASPRASSSLSSASNWSTQSADSVARQQEAQQNTVSFRPSPRSNTDQGTPVLQEADATDTGVADPIFSGGTSMLNTNRASLKSATAGRRVSRMLNELRTQSTAILVQHGYAPAAGSSPHTHEGAPCFMV